MPVSNRKNAIDVPQLNQVGGGPYAATLSGNLTVEQTGPRIFLLNPGGSNRDLRLPAALESYNGDTFRVFNTGSVAANIRVKDDGSGSTIVSVAIGRSATVYNDGGSYVGVVEGAGGGGVAADLVDTTTFYDPVDDTKKVRLDAGSVTAGQTRVVGVPDRDVDLGNLDDTTTFFDAAAATKKGRIDVGAVTAGQTRVLALPDYDVDLANLVDDTTFYDASATTKKVRLDASAVTAGQTRVLTMADADVDLANLVDDTTFYDASASTKKVRLDASGVTAGQTRALVMADNNIDLGTETIEVQTLAFYDAPADTIVKFVKAPSGCRLAGIVGRASAAPSAGTIAVGRDIDNTVVNQLTTATVNATTILAANTQYNIGTLTATAADRDQSLTSWIKVTVTNLALTTEEDAMFIGLRFIRSPA